MISSKSSLLIDLNIIRDNYKSLCNICNNVEVAATVKANCYGLGLEKITPTLEDAGCRNFFVTNINEAVLLRKLLKHNTTNIYVLNGYFIGDQEDFIFSNLTPVLNSLSQVEAWQALSQKMNKKLPCILHVNTGMNRLGIPEKEIEKLLDIISTDKINVLCLMSHLASAEEVTSKANIKQLLHFKKLAQLFPHAAKSLANSSGIFLGADYHFDLVRPGAALYGINPTPYLSETIVKNPITLTSPIIQLNHVNKDEFIGYNETYQVERNCTVATLPIGYADGYPRSLSNQGIVFINGYPAKVIGRISMDLITVDVSEIPQEHLFLGQKAEIIGPNNTPELIAKLAGTSAYEILTMLGNRYNKIYNEINLNIVRSIALAI